ncbi:plant intracellular Ras-group-related LRR protein 4 [Trichogramma pretiosum]|uniref:plant intracellular Ras-group-related LRR protein 4 n=1 Tax=Trichogramma pretiosum TaxID=7493 RepID=UPI0006C97233|nr:plant intracellular Ras-group-related LRR protein 4 [Trichogramma pretiosum]
MDTKNVCNSKDSEDMVKEIQDKDILHWNYRGLKEIPEAIRHHGTNIKEIYLKNNELTSLPSWLKDCSEVTNLYFYGNNIERVPDALGQMSHLTVLDISANRLSEFPTCLAYLKNLQSLSVDQNSITRLPTSLERLKKLERLSISGNQIVVLPEWLGTLPRLTELLADNNLIEEIPNRLTLSTSLELLSVRSNKLNFLPMNGFLSNPIIRFDSNLFLNYLSLPVLLQLFSKTSQPSSQVEAGGALAYGCFSSRNNDKRRYDAGIKLLLISDRNSVEYKEVAVQLPRQLLAVHTHYENVTISLWESSLRKVYASRYRHTLDINIDPPDVITERDLRNDHYLQDVNSQELSFVSYNLILNGPISICVNQFCNQPIFTEAWIIFAIGKSTFLIPNIIILCSYRCAVNFLKTPYFMDNFELYRLHHN